MDIHPETQHIIVIDWNLFITFYSSVNGSHPERHQQQHEFLSWLRHQGVLKTNFDPFSIRF